MNIRLIWGLLSSKGGIIGISMVIFACLGLWHKTMMGAKNLQISSLNKDKIELKGKVLKQKNLKVACKLNLSSATKAISYQNDRINDLQAANAEILLKSNFKAVAVLGDQDATDDKVRKKVNDFFNNTLGGGIQ